MKSKTNSDSNNESDTESSSSIDQNEVITDIDPVKFFSVKELCYYKMIEKFFKQCSDENISKMIDIIDGKSNISLRILDWFVTKYSKKRIDCGSAKDTEIFDVRISYKSQLKSYKKRYFDPFRRRKKFIYHFEGEDHSHKSINTTLGQLNFFKWAFINNIIVYVEKNLKQISKEMNQSNKEDKDKKKKKIKEGKEKSDEEKKVKKINKTKTKKSSSDSENTGNVKINAIKTTDNDEVQIVLKFD